MKALYASTMYPPAVGGAQIHLHRLAREVQRAGHCVRVVTQASRNRNDWLRMSTVAADSQEEYDYEGIPVARLGVSLLDRARMLPWAAAYYAAIGPCARRLATRLEARLDNVVQDPAVIHFSRIGREFLAIALADLARKRQLPFVLTPNHHPRWHGRRYAEYDRLYREADALIALTEAERDALIRTKNVREDRVHVTGIGPVLAPAPTPDEFRHRLNIRSRFVLFVGQQFPYKGVAALVAAATRVWKRCPDVHFVFIGPTTAFSRRLFHEHDDPRIVNLGCVNLATKTSAMAACELLCLPSEQESFGGVFIEAWSLRKPVIGGRIPPIACVIDEGRDGLLSSQSPDELADTLMQLLDNPQTARALGEAGWRKTQERYSWPALARRTLSVYESLGVHIQAEELTSADDRCPSKAALDLHCLHETAGDGSGEVMR
jgi:glycosyltransferase involved in cell wall biosynthesis